MRGRKRTRSAPRLAAVAAAAAAATAILAPASAQARDATVTSFDGTPITTHYFPAAGLPAGGQAPTVLVGSGWSLSGETNPDGSGNAALESFGATAIGVFVHNGYNVVTWDPRGFGTSGGTVQVNDPAYEGRDTQALIDFTAAQPESLLDAPGDPRVGMAGSSYGGMIQLVTAGIDRRIDAIAPNIAPRNLTSSLFKERAVKSGWGLALIGAGAYGSTVPGLISPTPQTGHMDPHIYDLVADGVTNSVSDENYDWIASKGPGYLVKNIRVPTLLTQGTADTLFTLQEGIENFDDLAAHSGRPLKMLWFCGGHGACSTSRGPSGYVADRTLAWLDRYLKRDKSVDTGPRFEWLADDGVWRSAANYPLRAAGALSGHGSGTLPIGPATPSGGLVFATPVAPAVSSVEVAIPGPAADSDVVGAPQLKLTYSGQASAAQTIVYAQIVDPSRNIVVGNQATPIPLTLDGETHTVERPLEPIASRAAAGSGYRLQIIPSTTLYGLQTSLGVADFSAIDVSLPLVDAAGTPGPPVPPPPVGSARKKKAQKKKCSKRKTRKARKRCRKRASRRAR